MKYTLNLTGDQDAKLTEVATARNQSNLDAAEDLLVEHIERLFKDTKEAELTKITKAAELLPVADRKALSRSLGIT